MNSTRLPYFYMITLTILMVLIYFILHRLGEFDLYDFQVYYNAAKGVVCGSPVYGVPFALTTGFYKYSPASALFFVPLSYLPLSIAVMIQYVLIMILSLAASVTSFRLIQRFIFPNRELPQNLILTLSLIPLIIHIQKELALGNVNMLLLLVTMLAQEAVLNKKHILAGVLFALVIMTKPYFGLLIIPLIAMKSWKVIGYLLLSLLLSPLLVFVVAGTRTPDLYIQWFAAMMNHSSMLSSTHYLGYLIESLGYSKSGTIYLISAGAMIMLITIAYRRCTMSKLISDRAFLLLGWSLYAVVPNLVVTDTEHFLAATPLILFCISSLLSQRQKIATTLFIPLAIGFGLNSRHILSDSGMIAYTNWGVLGICNIGIILLSAYLFYTQNKNNSTALDAKPNPKRSEDSSTKPMAMVSLNVDN